MVSIKNTVAPLLLNGLLTFTIIKTNNYLPIRLFMRQASLNGVTESQYSNITISLLATLL